MTREITTHRTGSVENAPIRIEALAHEMSDHYVIYYGRTFHRHIVLSFIKQSGEGLTEEALLAVLIDRMEQKRSQKRLPDWLPFDILGALYEALDLVKHSAGKGTEAKP